MVLRYIDAEGRQTSIELGSRVVIIGRAEEADVVLADERASRIHCEVRPWDEEYVIKDLKSRNGTFVNGNRIEVATLQYGDTIRVGSTQFHVDKKASKGATTVLREVSQEMDKGKGYRTILREIVKSTSDKDKTKEK